MIITEFIKSTASTNITSITNLAEKDFPVYINKIRRTWKLVIKSRYPHYKLVPIIAHVEYDGKQIGDDIDLGTMYDAYAQKFFGYVQQVLTKHKATPADIRNAQRDKLTTWGWFPFDTPPDKRSDYQNGISDAIYTWKEYHKP